MASKLLICCASPLVVPNKTKSGPLAAGFGPPSVVTLPSSSRAYSLVAKAQDQPGSEINYPINSPRYERSPWRHTESPDKVEISYDMPAYLPENMKADIIGDILHLYGRENESANFVRLASYPLPPNCDKSIAEGVLKHVLTINIPKSTVDVFTNIPIRSG